MIWGVGCVIKVVDGVIVVGRRYILGIMRSDTLIDSFNKFG